MAKDHMRIPVDGEKRLLQVMLWVVIAAGIGGCLVLGSAGSATGRLLATGTATAIACVAILLGVELLKHPTTKVAGFLFLPLVLVEYLLIVTQIWDLSDVLSRFKVARLEYVIDQTTGLLALTVVVIIGALFARKTPVGPRASWLAIGLTISSFLLVESSLWSGPYSYSPIGTAGRTNFMLLGLAVLCYAGEGATKRRNWRYLGVAAAIGAWAMQTSAVWWLDDPISQVSQYYTLYCTMFAVAVTIAHANLCMFAKVSRKLAWIRWISIGATALAAASAVLAISFLFSNPTKFLAANSTAFNQIATRAGLIAATSSITLCILALMNRKCVIERTTQDLEQLELRCPRCRATQLHGQNDDACTSCGLRITVQFEEPRCISCSYLLVGLPGDVCPECGVAFVEPGASGSSPT